MRSRLSAAVGSAVFLVVAPGGLAGYGPWAITRWHIAARWALGLRGLGALLLLAGAACVLEAFARFVFVGRGTPAPIAPPERLVVTGLYRYVRNPMYLAVLALIVGQALLLGSMGLLEYAAIVALGFEAFVRLYEEPTLRDEFGDEYEAYCRRVGRWVPKRGKA